MLLLLLPPTPLKTTSSFTPELCKTKSLFFFFFICASATSLSFVSQLNWRRIYAYLLSYLSLPLFPICLIKCVYMSLLGYGSGYTSLLSSHSICFSHKFFLYFSLRCSENVYMETPGPMIREFEGIPAVECCGDAIMEESFFSIRKETCGATCTILYYKLGMYTMMAGNVM